MEWIQKRCMFERLSSVIIKWGHWWMTKMIRFVILSNFLTFIYIYLIFYAYHYRSPFTFLNLETICSKWMDSARSFPQIINIQLLMSPTLWNALTPPPPSIIKEWLFIFKTRPCSWGPNLEGRAAADRHCRHTSGRLGRPGPPAEHLRGWDHQDPDGVHLREWAGSRHAPPLGAEERRRSNWWVRPIVTPKSVYSFFLSHTVADPGRGCVVGKGEWGQTGYFFSTRPRYLFLFGIERGSNLDFNSFDVRCIESLNLDPLLII